MSEPMIDLNPSLKEWQALFRLGLLRNARDAARDWHAMGDHYFSGLYDAYRKVLTALEDETLPERIEDCR